MTDPSLSQSPLSRLVAVAMAPLCTTTRLFVGTLLLVAMIVPAAAQSPADWIGHGNSAASIASRDSGTMMRLVQPLSDAVEKSVVQVFCNGRVVSLGTVVSADGYIITKRSELSGDPISVRVPNGKKIAARVSAVRPDNDLALIKLDGSDDSEWDIRPATFSNPEPPTGSFVISPGREGFTFGLGVLGVSSRHIGHQGRLGVRFYNTPSGPATVLRVAPHSGAEEAGLQDGDRILKINDLEILGSQAAISTLGKMYPGDVVRLTIVRGDDTIERDAMMSDQAVLMESKNDAKVNGPRNVRLSGFDSVMQHDTVLAPNQCGGPLLDSNGNVIGINIARAGRVVSYALPASLVSAEIISMLEEARR
ncbi:PDZ domain-containing protein [Stieleria sp. TO1_6]|uniref:trypsin-like peptidase domain-containing protein n=1 Tax=Stieleria tagensis TaxID=2956795 RepID=UPI00209B93CA|nr:trypsin-like peptidase domain-containing protein [Stieleria tagensis]MCO8124993.1 PDZ domain-containing protein [Stieleria tagensis]